MILKSAENAQNCSYPYLFTKDARTAWFKIIESISISKGRNVKLLLPAYIGINDKEGSGVFDAVSKSNADFVFYKVTGNLQVDIEDFNHKIQNEHFDLALVIHYFGFSKIDMDWVKATCGKNNVILVEDCAHAFYIGDSVSKIGSYGDFSFYSLHKYLAVSTGGLLRINNSLLPEPELNSEDMIDFSVLERFSSSDFNEIAKIRKKNYRSYQEKIVSNDNVEVLFDLNDADIPQTFPIRVKNGLREKLYFYLLERNMPTTALYYRMISEIDVAKYPLSFTISSEILNLPVHQDTSNEDIEMLCISIKNFFNIKG